MSDEKYMACGECSAPVLLNKDTIHLLGKIPFRCEACRDKWALEAHRQAEEIKKAAAK